MVTVAIVTIVSFIVSNFLGYWIHWAIHQKWSGPFYRAHMQHHLELYPVGNLTSTNYRDAHWYNRGPFLFTPPFIALMMFTVGLAHIFSAPMWIVVEIAFMIVLFGYINDWVHDSFHLKNHVLSRYRYYRIARRAHLMHHVRMNKNYGIISFEWDKIFGTAYQKGNK